MKIPRPLAMVFFSLPWILALCGFAWIILLRFPPSGIFIATSQLDGRGAFIHPFLPSERVSVPGTQPDGWTGQRITDDPTYFTATIPGPYEQVEVGIEFRPVGQTLLEFGMVRDAAGKELDMRPMYSAELQSDQWTRVENGYVQQGSDMSLFSRGDIEGLASWNASTSMPLLQDTESGPVTTTVSLRGAHDLYLVPVSGSIDVTFHIQDVNRTPGKGLIVFRVFRGDEEIRREAFDAGGRRDLRMGSVFEHQILVPHALPGVYRISFQADDDVFIRSIRTTSTRWVVGPRVHFGDVVGYATGTAPARAWTNSRHIVMETFHQEGLQDVELAGTKVRIVRTHQTVRLDRLDAVAGSVLFSAPKGDIRVVGDGWFAFRPDAFFMPKPIRLTDATSLDRERIHGVMTAYERPVPLGDGWYRARFSWPIDSRATTLRFVLSAPGILSRVGAVDVRRITMTYHRPMSAPKDWWKIVRQELANAWHRRYLR